MENSPFFIVAEAAAFAKVSVSTVRNWYRSGRLPHHRAPQSRKILILKSDLEAFLVRHGPSLKPAA